MQKAKGKIGVVNYERYNPVITISVVGTLLVSILRLYYHLRQLFGRNNWQLLVPDHHEDPLTMTFKEKLYLGYKYYYKAVVTPEQHSGLDEYFKNQTLQPAVPEGFIAEKKITINAGGDLIPYTCITPAICKNLWDEVGDFFFDADIVFSNLEAPADFSKPVSAAPEVMLHDMYFNADESTFDIFNGNKKFKGYDVLSIANNHSLDFGEESLLQTMRMLSKKQIAYTGAAQKAEEKNDFPVIERNGIKVAFLAATFSFNKEELATGKSWLCNHILLNQTNPDISLLTEQAATARRQGTDIVIAALHMGCAYQAYPGIHTVTNARLICDNAGIDILIAGHPHHAQPLEFYNSPVTGRQHLIVYSLGDFIAYDIFKWGHLTMLLQLQISKGTLNGDSHTCLTGIKIKPVYMHAEEKAGKITSLKLLDYLQAKNNAAAYFNNNKDIVKFEETCDFFERFVVLPYQQHVLV